MILEAHPPKILTNPQTHKCPAPRGGGGGGAIAHPATHSPLGPFEVGLSPGDAERK